MTYGCGLRRAGTLVFFVVLTIILREKLRALRVSVVNFCRVSLVHGFRMAESP